MKKTIFASLLFMGIISFISLANPNTASAHCDTLDGPVVSAAQKALDSGNPNYVLIWVQPKDEEKIKEELKSAKKRIDSGDKSAATDFFGTVVKIHREGEGATYTGLKPAGEVEPEIAMADKALETKDASAILTKLSGEIKEKISHIFEETVEKSNFGVDEVSEGREFVESYVTYVHAVEAALQGRPVLAAEHSEPAQTTETIPTLGFVNIPVITVLSVIVIAALAVFLKFRS